MVAIIVEWFHSFLRQRRGVGKKGKYEISEISSKQFDEILMKRGCECVERERKSTLGVRTSAHLKQCTWEYKNRWERILIERAERGECNRCVLNSNCEMMMIEKPFQHEQCAGQSSGKQPALTEPFLETYRQLSKVINLTHTNEDILIYLSSQWLIHPFIHHEMCGGMVQGHLATHTIPVKGC